MAKRKNIGTLINDQSQERPDLMSWAKGLAELKENLRFDAPEEAKIYAIYKIAQYFGLQYEKPDLFYQEKTDTKVGILHKFFLEVLTPSLQFYKKSQEEVSIRVLKNHFHNRNEQFDVRNIFYGDEIKKYECFEHFHDRIQNLIDEIPKGTITLGLQKQQDSSYQRATLVMDILKALDPTKSDTNLLTSIMIRVNEHHQHPDQYGLDALTDLIIVRKKLQIPLSTYTKDNTTLESVYELLKI